MKNRYSVLVLGALFLGSFGLILSCKHEVSIAGQYDSICFDTKIQPLIAAKCGRCHGGGSGREVHPSLMTYDEIRREVTPYNSTQSRLYSAITSLWENPMPPDSGLSLEERLTIRVWIDQGAFHTVCPVDTHHYVPPPIIIPDTSKAWVNPFACYTRDIVPIFASHCSMTGCHDAVSRKEGLDMSSYAKVMAYINDGSAGIVPFNPNASKIYQAITGSGDNDIMPPSSKDIPLKQAEIDSIYRWISRGAKDTVCGETCDTTNVTFAAKVWPIIQNACTGCHSGASPSSGISLTNYTQINAIASNGKLLSVIRRVSTFPMPPSYVLPKCKVRTIEIWVNAGALNN